MALEQGNTSTPLSASDPIYDAGSDLYTRGEIVEHPPSVPDFEGLPPGPHPEQIRDVQIDLHNSRAEVQAARQVEGKGNLNLAAFLERRQAESETVEWQGALAELASLDHQASIMAEGFPQDREQRRSELRERLELKPERDEAALRLAAAQQKGIIGDCEGRVIFDQRRLEQLEEAQRRYARRELEHAARRAYWGVADEGDARRLREGGADAGRVPKRVQPSR
jgi:hypothetical protein